MKLISYSPVVLLITFCLLTSVTVLLIFVLKKRNQKLTLVFGTVIFLFGSSCFLLAYNSILQCVEKASGDIENFYGTTEILIAALSTIVKPFGGGNKIIIVCFSTVIHSLGMAGFLLGCHGLLIVAVALIKKTEPVDDVLTIFEN